MNNPTPTLSVIVPVYNAGTLLKECVDSILSQTFTDFELLILNDGSTDNCLEFLKECIDNRIQICNLEHNYIETLNYGLNISRGKYIAKMDADDICYPTRFEEQIKVLEEDPSLFMCCTDVETIGKPIKHFNIEGKLNNYLLKLVEENFIFHPTVIFNAEHLNNNNLRYRDTYKYAEDYKLWSEMAIINAPIYYINKPLVKYRIHENSVSNTKSTEMFYVAHRIKLDIITYLLSKIENERVVDSIKKIINHYIELSYYKYIPINNVYKLIPQLFHE